MYDRRYPHMEPIARAVTDLSDEDARAVRSCAAEVERRTGTHAFFDRSKRKVFFASSTDLSHGGPLSVDLKACRRDRVDDMVEWINFGKVDRATKERWARESERREKEAKEEFTQKFLAERRPDALAYAAFLDRARRGMSRIISV